MSAFPPGLKHVITRGACSVCGLLENALSSECYGARLVRGDMDLIEGGTFDLRGGEWVQGEKYPEFYREMRGT